MATMQLYSQDGAKKSTMNVADVVWNVPVKTALVHQAVRTLQANRRNSIANTLLRGEVRGGGKKPWKQKGTGRARHGSTRSPIWIGGGITFGPRAERNFELRLNKKMKKKAMCMALTSKLAEGKLFALESIMIPEAKTKLLASVLEKMPLQGDLLLVIDSKNENVQNAAKNLDNVWVSRPEALSIGDILKFRRIAVVSSAVPAFEKLFGAKA